MTSYFKSGPRRNLLLVTLIVAFTALTARVVFVSVRGVEVAPDSRDYIRLAQNLRSHGSFSEDAAAPFNSTIRRPPVYPLFLVPFVSPEGVSSTSAVTAQILLDVLATVLLLFLAQMVMELKWAAVAALGYAIHPGAIYSVVSLLSESLFTFLAITGVVLACYGFRRNLLLITALAGIVFGLATLTRPIGLFLPFVLVGATLLSSRFPRRLQHAFLLVCCGALVVLPWTIRCSRSAQHLVLVQSATPVVFYVGTRFDWNQQDQETLWPRFLREDPYGRRISEAKDPKELVEADQFGLRLALQNIRAQPKQYLMSRARSFPYLFITSFDKFTGVKESFRQSYNSGNWLRLIVKAGFLLAFSLVPFLLGMLGLVTSRRDAAAAFCAAVWLFTWVINFPNWVEYRYWIPAVPFLLVTATDGVRMLSSKFRAI